ncbi:MAG: hypothetical protein HOQ29_19300 [Acidobacteria bacterium]|nr:hypothetical protein [Acidobacteriota bacterium]
MKIVVDAGYHGHAGIKYGPEGRELEGVKELRQQLEAVRERLTRESEWTGRAPAPAASYADDVQPLRYGGWM